jgi:UDP-N-acetylglucosamine 4-epimerase
MIKILQAVSGKDIQPVYGPERAGDVKHSKADITKIGTLLGYNPEVLFKAGLERIFPWYQEYSAVKR